MSDYLKNWPSHKGLGSVKYIWNVKIFNLEPKKLSVFFLLFSDKTFHPETASKNMTYGSFHQGRESTGIVLDFLLFCSEAYTFVDKFVKLL